MRNTGIVLMILGFIGLIISVINYINQTEKFGIFGLEVTISEGSIIPIIVTGAIFIVGFLFTLGKRSRI
jgi:hypothetical protein